MIPPVVLATLIVPECAPTLNPPQLETPTDMFPATAPPDGVRVDWDRVFVALQLSNVVPIAPIATV